MRFLVQLASAAVIVAVTGCGPATTDVAGKVTYQGKPVVYGTVVFIGADGTPKSGAIQLDGTYRVTGVPIGTARVAVSSPPPPGVTLPGRKTKSGKDDLGKGDGDVAQAHPDVVQKWFAIPEKYGEPTQSGRTVEVKAGQAINLDLD
jgi:hypothetical protein